MSESNRRQMLTRQLLYHLTNRAGAPLTTPYGLITVSPAVRRDSAGLGAKLFTALPIVLKGLGAGTRNRTEFACLEGRSLTNRQIPAEPSFSDDLETGVADVVLVLPESFGDGGSDIFPSSLIRGERLVIESLVTEFDDISHCLSFVRYLFNPTRST